MEKYDINDPTDLDIMKSDFDYITADEWEEYAAYAEDQKMGYKNVNALKSAIRKAGIAKYLSPKMLRWCLSLVDKIEDAKDAAEKEAEEEEKS